MTNDAGQPQSDLNPRQKLEQAATAGRAASGHPEERLWQGGYSAKAMYGTWLLMTLLTIVGVAALLILGNRHEAVLPIGGALILFLWCFAIGMYLYRRLSVHYELSSQRFIHQHGILIRSTDRIEVIDIDDVGCTQGIIQRMLNVGTIKLTGSDRTHPEFHMHGIDDVHRIASLIDDARRAERRRRGLHIETI